MLEIRRTCPGAWVDFNGHMRDAYYLLLVSFANDQLMEELGMGPAYLARTGRTLFNLDSRILYLREARAGDRLKVEMRLVDHDARRLHLHALIVNETRGGVIAADEEVLMHVNTAAGPRAEAFPPEIAALAAERRARDGEPPAPRVGGVGLRRPAPLA